VSSAGTSLRDGDRTGQIYQSTPSKVSPSSNQPPRAVAPRGVSRHNSDPLPLLSPDEQRERGQGTSGRVEVGAATEQQRRRGLDEEEGRTSAHTAASLLQFNKQRATAMASPTSSSRPYLPPGVHDRVSGGRQQHPSMAPPSRSPGNQTAPATNTAIANISRHAIPAVTPPSVGSNHMHQGEVGSTSTSGGRPSNQSMPASASPPVQASALTVSKAVPSQPTRSPEAADRGHELLKASSPKSPSIFGLSSALATSSPIAFKFGTNSAAHIPPVSLPPPSASHHYQGLSFSEKGPPRSPIVPASQNLTDSHSHSHGQGQNEDFSRIGRHAPQAAANGAASDEFGAMSEEFKDFVFVEHEPSESCVVVLLYSPCCIILCMVRCNFYLSPPLPCFLFRFVSVRRT